MPPPLRLSSSPRLCVPEALTAHSKSACASAQTPLFPPFNTTTIRRFPFFSPLATKQYPAAFVNPVFIPSQIE